MMLRENMMIKVLRLVLFSVSFLCFGVMPVFGGDQDDAVKASRDIQRWRRFFGHGYKWISSPGAT